MNLSLSLYKDKYKDNTGGKAGRSSIDGQAPHVGYLQNIYRAGSDIKSQIYRCTTSPQSKHTPSFAAWSGENVFNHWR